MPKFVILHRVPASHASTLEHEWMRWSHSRPARPATIWQPHADVHETASAYSIKVELAGMRDAEIEVTVDDGRLLVRGTRAEQRTAAVQRVHELGISYGPFQLEFAFSKAIDESAIVARYDDGILLIELPRRSIESTPRRIAIRVDESSLTPQ